MNDILVDLYEDGETEPFCRNTSLRAAMGDDPDMYAEAEAKLRRCVAFRAGGGAAPLITVRRAGIGLMGAMP